jgi:photosystem II stability/assembly factor-like uncharacterized protein
MLRKFFLPFHRGIMHATICIFMMMLAAKGFAQSVWEYEGGPCGGTFLAIIDHNSGLAAAPSYRPFVLFGNAEGTSWRQADLPEAAAEPFSLYSVGGRLLAGTFGRVYRTDDDGASWQVAEIPAFQGAQITRLSGSGDTVYACGGGLLSRSTNRGVYWEPLTDVTCNDVTMSESGHVVVAEESRLVESTDGGGTWFVRSGTPADIKSLFRLGDIVFATREESSLPPGEPVIFRLGDPASGSWEAGTLLKPWLTSMTEHDGVLYAGSNSITGPHFLRSLDGGLQWEVVNETRAPFPRPKAVSALHGAAGGLLAAVTNLGIWRLEDNAESWHYETDGFFPVGVARVGFIGDRIVAYSMKENFVATRSAPPDPWELLPYVEEKSPGDMLVKDGIVILGTTSGTRSTGDLGLTWDYGVIGNGTRRVLALGSAGSRIIAGAESGVSAWSADLGESWTTDSTTNIQKWYTFAMRSSGEIFAATSPVGLHFSTDAGATWVQQTVPLMTGAIFDVATYDDTVFIASNKGIAKYFHDGQQQPLLYARPAYRLLTTPYGLVAATQDDGIILFPGYGTIWGTLNQSLPEAHYATPDVCRIAFNYHEGRLYFGNCAMPGLWSISLATATTYSESVTPESTRIDAVFPQPVNAEGWISLRAPEAMTVRLVLRDLLGRGIRTLYEGRLPHSPFIMPLHTGNIADGNYLLEFTAGATRDFRVLSIFH